MYVRALSVTDFRSWSQADLTFEPGVSVLVGANGQGKTNLVEAVGYLATLASHRVSSDAPLVRRGASTAIVRAAVVNEGRELTVQLEISAGKANRARVNRSPVPRTRDVLGIVRTVVFAPEDLTLVRGDPSERRRLLDDLLVARAPRWAGVRAEYDKVLKQRSALLKTARNARGDTSTLDVWDAHLARAGASLTAGRLALVDDLAPHVTQAYADVAPESVPVGARYRAKVEAIDAAAAPGVALPGTDELEAALLEEMRRRRGQEIERGVCLVGPHRDELELTLGEGPAKGYASHGESWALALALRLAGFELLRGEGSEPVLVLDDVFAELDVRRRRALARTAARAEQVLVTAAVDDDVPEELRGTRYVVESGTVREMSAAGWSAGDLWVIRMRDARREGGDRPVDGVDNSSFHPRETDHPDTETGVELGSREGPVVHTPSGAAPESAPVPPGTPRRGADLARDALEAARAASAARRAERGADPRRAAPRRSGASGIGRPRRRGWSGARADERDPQSLGRLASRLSGQRGWAPKLAHGSVFGRWAELVGAEVAEHATPTALRDGELTVQADSTAWATQLRLLQRTLLARLSAGLGPGVVTKMRIHGPSAPSWRRGPRHVSGRGPRDTYG